MAEILCSTGAILGRPNGRDFHLLEDFSKRLDFDGFELLIYDDWYSDVDHLISFLQGLELNIPVIHCDKNIGELISIGGEENFKKALDILEINCRIATNVGARKLVLHLWSGVPSDKEFENNIEMYPRLIEVSDSYKLSLLVENVVCNQKDPMTRCLELLEYYPEIGFVYDTKMAEFHQQVDLLYLPQNDIYAKNIRHYHVNDYGGGYMNWNNLRVLTIGSGHVDFERFFKYIKDIGYDGTITLEATGFDSNGNINFEMLNAQIPLIKEYLR